MSIKPILFNTEMVHAIQEGKKSVTRRLIKVPQNYKCYGSLKTDEKGCLIARFWNMQTKSSEDSIYFKAPYKEGDTLYVRETWTWLNCLSCEDCIYPSRCPENPTKSDGCYVYRAIHDIAGDTKWRPSIHMPKEAARIWLKVADVHAERLQDITAEEIRREGLKTMAVHCGDMTIAQAEFKVLWNSTVRQSDLEKYGWDANPYVWVISFELCKKPGEE